ncbi:hypothetical protein EVAR_63789_1 [Eumeta japonica]|uniref:Uncharacterized protein n=1 Tax=Eumeta variegata TaxID=151549 RepID=A0A4C1ZK16_EUMVA|nr:hypothetical protein EVAR_63789_1 [Eumeta japonica]
MQSVRKTVWLAEEHGRGPARRHVRPPRARVQSAFNNKHYTVKYFRNVYANLEIGKKSSSTFSAHATAVGAHAFALECGLVTGNSSLNKIMNNKPLGGTAAGEARKLSQARRCTVRSPQKVYSQLGFQRAVSRVLHRGSRPVYGIV